LSIYELDPLVGAEFETVRTWLAGMLSLPICRYGVPLVIVTDETCPLGPADPSVLNVVTYFPIRLALWVKLPNVAELLIVVFRLCICSSEENCAS
jgi:hypothetical protein